MKKVKFLVTICFICFSCMDAQQTSKIKITVGSGSFVVTLSDNATARAFASLLPMTVTMEELNGNEKFHYLSGNLPSEPKRPSQIQPGDLMLYGQNCVVLFYEPLTTSYTYSKIGSIENSAGLKEALGPDNPEVTFELIKSTSE